MQTILVQYNGLYGSGVKDGWKRVGYSFDGWFTDKTGGTRVTSQTTVTNNRNHTLYAHWKPNSYFIYFDANGGFGNMERQKCKYDSGYTLNECTYYLPGYECIGWSTTKNGKVTYGKTSSVRNLKSGNNDSITLYAVWKKKINVSFDYNYSGTVTYHQIFLEGEKYGTLPGANRTGFTFLGWYTQPIGGMPVTKDSRITGTENFTLYAHWGVKVYFPDFDYEMDAAEGETITIPSDIAGYETEVSYLLGFSTSMAALRPDNGTNKRYTLPTGLTEPTVSLFGVMAPLVTDSGMVRVGTLYLEYAGRCSDP